ncbi:hypothetical protein [Frigidibacter sp.]|uniref:hypothetical protein n=1 Tax=Frigidibacter sp. TaxID=2586418 RepID=UPI0027371266|nr:hypothetical protein [Frigidibacter sp.]MDP3342223.1 hypothetical protein [Frigidibacter sp.]
MKQTYVAIQKLDDLAKHLRLNRGFDTPVFAWGATLTALEQVVEAFENDHLQWRGQRAHSACHCCFQFAPALPQPRT